MAKQKNTYQKKAEKKQLLEGVASEPAKGNIKKTALDTGRDMLIGAIGGGLAGAALGRSSLLVGAVVTGVGHFMGSSGAAALGVGMMASGGYQTIAGAVNGTEKEGLDGVKERLVAFRDEFKRKLFLDKILKGNKKAAATTDKPAAEEQPANGVGEVQYFTYPAAKELEGANDNNVDMSALERIEKQVEQSAKNFEAKQQQNVQGLEGDADDIRDKNW